MDRFRSLRGRIQAQPPPPGNSKAEETPPPSEPHGGGDGRGGGLEKVQPPADASEGLEPFMGIKVRRRGSLHQDCKGDYLDVPSYPTLVKIVSKHGGQKVLFADKVLKFTGSGKIKRQILLITDLAMHLVDPESYMLKRRIALTAVEKLRLSELSDNFLAVIIPYEYDCLMASTRKTEIVTILVEATNSTSDELVEFSNRFTYYAAANLVKEIQFEDVEGNVRTRIVRKEMD